MSDYGYCPECGAPGVKRQAFGCATVCLNGHKRDTVSFNPPAPTRVREDLVESYLVTRVKETGGTVRKVTFPGHPGAPDRLVGWPGRHALVEMKRPRGKAKAHQAREHDRLRDIGFRVEIIDTKDGVDQFVEGMTR